MPTSEMASGLEAIQQRTIQFAKQNADAYFSFAGELAKAKMPDAELDEAIIEICQRMAKDRDKHRVTFYYLLAEKYGKLAAFSK